MNIQRIVKGFSCDAAPDDCERYVDVLDIARILELNIQKGLQLMSFSTNIELNKTEVNWFWWRKSFREGCRGLVKWFGPRLRFIFWNDLARYKL